jgi:hypothetical protein
LSGRRKTRGKVLGIDRSIDLSHIFVFFCFFFFFWRGGLCESCF